MNDSGQEIIQCAKIEFSVAWQDYADIFSEVKPDNEFYRVRKQAWIERLQIEAFMCCLITTTDFGRNWHASLRHIEQNSGRRRAKSGELENQLYGRRIPWPVAHLVPGADRRCGLATGRLRSSDTNKSEGLVRCSQIPHADQCRRQSHSPAQELARGAHWRSPQQTD